MIRQAFLFVAAFNRGRRLLEVKFSFEIVKFKMPKRSYSLAFKQNAVHTALNSCNRSAARAVGVDEKRIREWRSQLPLLQQQTSASRSAAKKRCRLPGGGRKPLLPEVEQTVADWVVLQRQGYHRVTRHGISLKAQEIAKAQGNNEFVASRGWVSNFMRRFDFTLRRKTTTGQRLPPELTAKVTKFVQFCTKQRNLHNLAPGSIGNMDETAIWADMPGDNSVASKGAKTVPVLTT